MPGNREKEKPHNPESEKVPSKSPDDRKGMTLCSYPFCEKQSLCKDRWNKQCVGVLFLFIKDQITKRHSFLSSLDK